MQCDQGLATLASYLGTVPLIEQEQTLLKSLLSGYFIRATGKTKTLGNTRVKGEGQYGGGYAQITLYICENSLVSFSGGG